MSNELEKDRSGKLVVDLRSSRDKFFELLYGDALDDWQENKRMWVGFKIYLITAFAPYVLVGKGLQKFFQRQTEITENDVEKLSKLIVKGREEGVESLEIKIDKKLHAGLSAQLGATGESVVIGKLDETSYSIRVDY